MSYADYPAAEWVPADQANFRSASRQWKDIKHVVIHCTDGRGDPRAVAEMWQDPTNRTSAHYVIGQDGTVLQCVRHKDIAEHAHDANPTSIGIEHCARPPGEPPFPKDDPGLPVSDAQYSASAKLVAWICYKAALVPDRDTIQGHAEIDPKTTHQNCPTQFTTGATTSWDWIRFMTVVTMEYEKLTEPMPSA